MREGQLETNGFEYYVDRVRRGERDVYAAYRVYEKFWRISGPQAARTAVLHKAAMLLLELDPWFLASRVMFLDDAGLTRSELERLEPTLGAGAPREVAVYLQAKLWFHGASSRRRPDAARALRRTVKLLAKVPARRRELDSFEMLAECHRRLGDWNAYSRVFPRLLALKEASWRSSPLKDMLEFAVKRREWRAYDRWRKEWDRLPPQRHSCECEQNDLGTLDGLRALLTRRWAEIPRHLAFARDVTGGCPHLNSYGFRLTLVGLLIKRRRHLAACREYLDRAAHFGSPRGLPALRKELRAAEKRADRATRPRRAKR